MNKLFVYGIGFTLIAFYLILKVPLQSQFGNEFLMWNLYLAFLPVVFAYLFVHTWKPIGYIFLILWLLFLPNSFYILTDLGHILKIYNYRPDIGRQFLIFNFRNITDLFNLQGLKFITIAGAGWCFGLSSMVMIFRNFNTSTTKNTVMTICVGFLCGVGVTLGRFYRWNSWDIVFQSGGILKDLSELFTTKTGLYTSFFFTILITLSLLITGEIITQKQLD